MSEPAGPEKPGRYSRSASGFIGSLLVTLLVIGAIVGFRSLTSNDLVARPDPVDYLVAVGYAQESGIRPVYPSELPDGWIATSAGLAAGDPPAWGLGMLTDSGTFVGLRQEPGSLDQLVKTYVDERTTEGDPLPTPGALIGRWRMFTDEGGDRAYAAEYRGGIVLVYGSASQADLETMLGLLTDQPR